MSYLPWLAGGAVAGYAVGRGRRAPKLVWHPVDAVLIQMAYPGTKAISRNRETGTITSITDERVAPEQSCVENYEAAVRDAREWYGREPTSEEVRFTPWGVTCDTHAAGGCDYTLKNAKIAQSYPTNFCSECIALSEEGVVLTPEEATSGRVEAMIKEGRKVVGDKYPMWREAGVTRARAALRKQGIKF